MYSHTCSHTHARVRVRAQDNLETLREHLTPDQRVEALERGEVINTTELATKLWGPLAGPQKMPKKCVRACVLCACEVCACERARTCAHTLLRTTHPRSLNSFVVLRIVVLLRAAAHKVTGKMLPEKEVRRLHSTRVGVHACCGGVCATPPMCMHPQVTAAFFDQAKKYMERFKPYVRKSPATSPPHPTPPSAPQSPTISTCRVCRVRVCRVCALARATGLHAVFARRPLGTVASAVTVSANPPYPHTAHTANHHSARPRHRCHALHGVVSDHQAGHVPLRRPSRRLGHLRHLSYTAD